jgi:OmpA-OmpF porin, OOP family
MKDLKRSWVVIKNLYIFGHQFIFNNKKYQIMRQLLCIAFFIFGATHVKAQEFKIENGQLILPSHIVFETGTNKLKPESEASLMHIKQFLDAKTYITLLRIEGHSDNNGLAAANQTLTEKRALTIAKWLVTKGIDCKRLLPVGFGDTKPIAENTTPEDKAQNRRIEIRMAAMRGKAIGGMPLDGGGRVAGDSCQ